MNDKPTRKATLPVVPSRSEFLRRCKEYRDREARDPMYVVATKLLHMSWGKPQDMADGLGVLLLTWNNAFYRYAPPDFDRLAQCVAENLPAIEGFKARDITSFSAADERGVRDLFERMLDALQAGGRKTPVGTAKGLHLLSPGFFPIWDAYIAPAYQCRYDRDPAGAYLKFCATTSDMARAMAAYPRLDGRTLVKLIDEYNYVVFTLPHLKQRQPIKRSARGGS